MRKYEWSAGLCGSNNYPMRVYQGDFYDDNDWAPMTSGGILEDAWGTNGMNMGYANIIPNRFKITYLSFAENKFYTGDFKLPADTIKALFEEGFRNPVTKAKATYEHIIVGLAPGGCIVVWMMGEGYQVEIGRYQAVETEVDWKLFNPNGEQNREVYVKDILSRRPHTLKIMEENRIDYEIWDTYRIRYNWKPRIILPERYVLDYCFLYMYNAERERLFDSLLIENKFKKRAVPERISFQWYDKNGTRFGSENRFNEEEIIQAYKELYGDDPDQECELVIRVDENDYNNLSIFLRGKTEEIEIRDRSYSGSYEMD